MEVFDLDGDGKDEILIVDHLRLRVYTGDGVMLWYVTLTGTAIAIGQMDDDPGWEIATSSGGVVDAASHTIQWTVPRTGSLVAGDIDADGREELIVSSGSTFAYDIEAEALKWTIPGRGGGVTLANADDDDHLEVLISETSVLYCHDTVTLEMEWFLDGDFGWRSHLTVADVDGDGDSEMVWAKGLHDSADDYLDIADLATREIEWETPRFAVPFLGPCYGDIDGDGRPELVTYNYGSSSDSSILVFDGGDLRMTHFSGPIGLWDTRAIRLADVDTDGDSELLIAGARDRDGILEIHDFDAEQGFSRVFVNAHPEDFDTFHTIEFADVDGDGEMEVVGSTGQHLHCFGYPSGDIEWTSPPLAGSWVSTEGLLIADFDDRDGLEILLQIESGSLLIFDATTGALEDTIQGEFEDVETTSRWNESRGPRPIILADSAGNFFHYRFDGEAYTIRRVVATGLNGLEGFTLGANLWVFIGANDRLRLWRRPGLETEYWRSGSYGRSFGEHAIVLPESRRVFTGGLDALVGFEW
jgi:hypothetical protein